MLRLTNTAFIVALPTLAAFVGGCVSAYDPSGPPRLGLGERGPGMVAPQAQRPADRLLVTVPPVVPAQPLQNEAVVPIRPAEVPEPVQLTVAPDAAATEQLQWIMRALSGDVTPRELRRIERRFAPEFLELVSGEEIRTVLRHWRRDQLGGGGVRLRSTAAGEGPRSLSAILEPTESDTYTLVRLSVDERGRIDGLWLAPALGVDAPELDSWENVTDAVAALDGEASLMVAEVIPAGPLRAIAAHEPSQDLAIGSTYKLFILGALAEMIAAGEAAWDQRLPIRDDLKSLPTGQMQLEAEEAEFPLVRYAELMISASDNTAADHLLALVGRERVEAYMARFAGADERNIPLLSTMDMFRLKLGADRELARRYAAADTQQQRAMLAPGGEVAQTIPSFAGALMWRSPYMIDTIEWFASTAELAAVMAELDRLAETTGMEPLDRILRINPGLAFNPQQWPRVAYKGGSEPGVINMTWLLTRADGREFALSTTWNNTERPVDLQRLSEIVGAAVSLLARGEIPAP